jgi:hypothetical protein
LFVLGENALGRRDVSNVVVCKAFGAYFLIIITILKEIFDSNSGIQVGEGGIWLDYGIMTKTACFNSVVIIDL